MRKNVCSLRFNELPVSHAETAAWVTPRAMAKSVCVEGCCFAQCADSYSQALIDHELCAFFTCSCTIALTSSARLDIHDSVDNSPKVR